jgi:hypothetical protein
MLPAHRAARGAPFAASVRSPARAVRVLSTPSLSSFGLRRLSVASHKALRAKPTGSC